MSLELPLLALAFWFGQHAKEGSPSAPTPPRPGEGGSRQPPKRLPPPSARHVAWPAATPARAIPGSGKVPGSPGGATASIPWAPMPTGTRRRPGPTGLIRTDEGTAVRQRGTIRRGSRGGDVAEWQRAMGITPADGDFGRHTESITKAWQASRGLVADGIVGNKSWGKAYQEGLIK